MKTKHILPSLLLAAFAPGASAAIIIADFNDLTGSDADLTGQAGGTGFTGIWAGSATVDVNSGDLTAPAATNFGISQGGGAQFVNGEFSSQRQSFRSLSTTLAGGTGGTIWFSLLFNSPDNTSRGALTFNETGASTFKRAVFIANGSVRLGLATEDGSGPATYTNNVDTLLVGSLTLSSTGDETISIWLNPDVSAGIGGLGTASTTKTEDAISLTGGITTIGVSSYEAGSAGGVLLDALRLSDNTDANQAFLDVTTVPEPSTALLGAIGAIALLRRRR